jgi:hypothetical protein
MEAPDDREGTLPMEAADDREGTLPAPIAENEVYEQGRTPPYEAPRDVTPPIITADEYVAEVMLTLSVPKRGRGRPRKVRPYIAPSYAEIAASQFVMGKRAPEK